MTPLKGPGDPEYDANTKQMREIYAKQGPNARKKDLDEATIAILEDCMNEKEDDTVDREKVRQEFKDRFFAMSDQELLDELKHETKKQGRGFARMNYLGLLREEMENREIN